jgi:hypothetical protein
MVNCLARIPKYRAKKMIGEMKEIDAKENIRRYRGRREVFSIR